MGFCHGVLNTDNMSVAGLTIDYGREREKERQKESTVVPDRGGSKVVVVYNKYSMHRERER